MSLSKSFSSQSNEQQFKTTPTVMHDLVRDAKEKPVISYVPPEWQDHPLLPYLRSPIELVTWKLPCSVGAAVPGVPISVSSELRMFTAVKKVNVEHYNSMARRMYQLPPNLCPKFDIDVLVDVNDIVNNNRASTIVLFHPVALPYLFCDLLHDTTAPSDLQFSVGRSLFRRSHSYVKEMGFGTITVPEMFAYNHLEDDSGDEGAGLEPPRPNFPPPDDVRVERDEPARNWLAPSGILPADLRKLVNAHAVQEHGDTANGVFLQLCNKVSVAFEFLITVTAPYAKEAYDSHTKRPKQPSVFQFDYWASKMTDIILGVVAERAMTQFKQLLPKALNIVCKSIVRWWLGYESRHLIFEIFCDASFGELMGTAYAALSNKVSTIFAQGSDMAKLLVTLVLSVVGTSLGASKDIVQSFLTYHRAADVVFPTGFYEALSTIPMLSSFIAISPTFQNKYPRSAEYLDLQASIGARPPKTYEINKIGRLWRASLNEFERMSPADRVLFRTHPGFKVPQETDATRLGMRPMPVVLYLSGKPGVGKTVMLNALTRYLVHFHRVGGYADPRANWADVCWSYSTGTDHCDGYRGQPIVIMNDFMTATESASSPDGSDSRFFMAAADTAEYVLPMAHLEQKGTVLRPAMIIITSNVDPAGAARLAHSINNKNAIARRIQHCFDVEPRNSERGLIVPDAGYSTHDQWILHQLDTTTGRATGHTVEFAGLIELVCRDLNTFYGKPPPHQLDEPRFLEMVSRLAEQPGPIVQAESFGQVSQEKACQLFRRLADFMGLDEGPSFSSFCDAFMPARASDPRLYPNPSQDQIATYSLVEVTERFSKQFKVVGQIPRYYATIEDAEQLFPSHNSAYRTLLMVGAAVGVAIGVGVLARKSAAFREHKISSAENISYLTVGETRMVRQKLSDSTGKEFHAYVPVGQDNVSGEAINLDKLETYQRNFDQEKLRKLSRGMPPKYEASVPSTRMERLVRSILVEGRHRAYATFIRKNAFITAAHVGKALHDRGAFEIDDGNKNHAFINQAPVGNMQAINTFAIKYDDTKDLCVVFLLTTHLASVPEAGVARLHPKGFTSGCVERLVKKGNGYTGSRESIEYYTESHTYKIAAHTVGIAGNAGFCGLPYVFTEGNQQHIAGFHVAGSYGETEASHFSSVSSSWALHMLKHFPVEPKERASAPVPEGAMATQMLREVGADLVGHSLISAPLNRSSSIYPVKDLHNEVLPCSYGVARLETFVKDGIVYDPVKIRLKKKLRQKDKKVYAVPTSVLKSLRRKFATLNRDDKWTAWTTVKGQPVPLWDKLVQNDADLNWTGVDRNKAGGSSCPHASKWFYFDVTEEQPTLTPQATALLDWHLTEYLGGKCAWEACTLALKDEKLPLTKVESGETRLFSAEEFCRLMVVKLFYGRLLRLFNMHAWDVFNIPIAVPPEEVGALLGRLHETGFECISSDVSGQEDGHNFPVWFYFYLTIRDAGLLDLPVSGRGVATSFPNLGRIDVFQRAAWLILYSVYNSSYLLRHAILRFDGSLPSGFLLTFIINCFSDLMCNELIEHSLTSAGINGKRFVMPFGDDQWFLISPELKAQIKQCDIDLCTLIREQYAACGYKVTGADKSPTLATTTMLEADFCGRRLHKSDAGWTMVLEKPRLFKSIQFCKGALLETFPGQVAVFLSELSRYGPDTFCEVYQGLRWNNGYSLADYLSAEQASAFVKAEKFSELERYATQWCQARGAHLIGPARPTIRAEMDGPSETDAGTVVENDSSLTVILAGPAEESNQVAPTTHRDTHLSAPAIGDLKDQFARAVKITEFDWTASQSRDTILYTKQVLSEYFNVAPNQQWKLLNSVFLKPSLVIRAQLSVNNFTAGMLLMSAIPKARQPQLASQICSATHSKLLAGSGQCAELRVPFLSDALVAQTPYINTTGATEGYFDFVKMAVIVGSPLVAVSNTTARVSIWVSIEESDVTMGGLTSTAPIAQSESEEMDKPGPLKRTVGGMIEASSRMGNVIKTTNEVASAGANLVGLSKPTTKGHQVRTVPQPNACMVSGVGHDESIVMGMQFDQKGIVSEEFAPEDDPMSIRHQGGRWGMLDAFAWHDTAGPQTILDTRSATPVGAPGDATAGVKPPVGYLCQLFNWYRGSTHFRFTAVKAPQHFGVLEVSVDFNGIANYTPTDEGRSTNLHRVIWNIADSPTLEVVVPYIHYAHLRSTKEVPIGASSDGPKIHVKVINPLTFPDTVASVIEIFLEVRSPDLEVAWPSGHLTDVEPTTPTSVSAKMKGKMKEVTAQSVATRPKVGNTFDVSPQEHAFTSLVHLGPKTPDYDVLAFRERHMGGEMVTSLRTVLKRFYVAGFKNFTQQSTVFDFNDVDAWPYAWRFISNMFVFGFGGYRVKTFQSGLVDRVWVTQQTLPPAPMEPETIFAEVPGLVSQFEIPNVSPLPIYVIKNVNKMSCSPAMQIYIDKHNARRVYVAFMDNFCFFLDNPLPPVYTEDYTLNETLPGFSHYASTF